ncbi:DUF2804 domain-containing protein [uncultured Sphaerochaeta sp.]|uniref:DUF2804 domain-containing protein n=1 Tax=uncultured Sphaerochaeta sp. TaxID=886478 RepID=UPI0029CA8E94|nr:DUF2804 domain-containing protein [uncultured Sphaerochaeta sp.]
MDHEVTQKQDLLTKKGRIKEEGWARHPLWRYDRSFIKGGRLRIKEWDYYAVINTEKRYAVTATISDLGYAALFAISYIDFERKAVSQTDAIRFFPLGKIGLSASSTEDNQVSWSNTKLRLAFIKKGTQRHLMVACPSLVLPDGSVGLDFDIVLTQEPESESLNIATSWSEQRKAFYLNEKVNCLPAKGNIRRGMEHEELLSGEAWGVLDWGRGRWTYTNTWYWASASTLVENVPFGLNLGYGFSDRSTASENAIFYNGKIHKLGTVEFVFSREELSKAWRIKDDQGRLNMVFTPVVDRSSKTNFIVIQSQQHQLFGYFSGTCILDDGSEIAIKEVPGFAEEVYNRW